MLGAGTVTVKLTPLLATPLTVTTTLPVVAPAGTGTAMLVALQLVGVAPIPLKATLLVPWVAPKFAPVIVTGVPSTPDVGFRLVMLGATVVAVAVKFTPVTLAPLTAMELSAVAEALVAPFSATVAPLPAAVGVIAPERLKPVVLNLLPPCPWLPLESVELTW